MCKASLRDNLRLNSFVPARVFGTVDGSGSFKDGVTHTHPAVGIHLRQTIVLVQLRLQSDQFLSDCVCLISFTDLPANIFS
jgi:hypothetical protein